VAYRPVTAPGHRREVRSRYLATQLAAIGSNETGAADGDPDAVHDMRVAVRRLRSTLRTFRPLFDRDRTEPLRPNCGGSATSSARSVTRR